MDHYFSTPLFVPLSFAAGRVLFFSIACCIEHLSSRKKRIVKLAGNLNLDIPEWEEYILLHINRYFSLLLLGAALVAPAVTMAGPKPQEGTVQVRIYDRDHRDYHNWDDREDRAYRRYYVVQRRTYREYDKQNSKAQRKYWKWRHTHPDND